VISVGLRKKKLANGRRSYYLDVGTVAIGGAMRLNLVGLNGINYGLKDPISTSTQTVIADDRFDVMPLPNNDMDYAYVSDQLNKPTAAKSRKNS
jgi:hypothetical protein